MTILEPMTMATDYVLAVLAAVLGWRLWLAGRAAGTTTVRLWSGSFLSTAFAAFVGGTSHGFAVALGSTGHAILWKLTVWSIGATTCLLLLATAYSAFAGAARRLLIAAAVAQFVVYAIWMWGHDDFIWVIADYLPAVIVVLVVQARGWLRGERGAGWLVAGIVTTMAGAGVQASGFTLHQHFNHNDLYHVIQMVATVMLYRGALVARDRAEAIS